ncbi:MAG: PQQ-binding-like beta-propeller repeat protein [Phycisphaerae bacterium]|nr:PQQ-binding-like beta-propeller repeat protein [Phycisphaerae bacterium]
MTVGRRFFGGVVLCAAIAANGLSAANADSPSSSEKKTVNWPQFRGPHARGVAKGFALPTRWNASETNNVRWKAPIPGLGHSSPVIWGDKLFVTTAISAKGDSLKVGLYGDISPVLDKSEHEWKVYCLDKMSGEIKWERTAHKGVPTFYRHTKATQANCTPATDGEHLVVFFGSEGLFCYDLDGRLLWKKDLGELDAGFYMVPDAQWGFGSSPIIWNDLVIVQCDVQKNSFVAALDVATGKEVWRTPRADVPTWGTPTVYEGPERAELIVNGYRHIGGYDPRTGKELWRFAGGADIPVPTPIVAHDLIFVTSSHSEPRPLYALRTGINGTVTAPESGESNEFIAWWKRGYGTYMQTPIVVGDLLFTCNDNGVFGVFDVATGETFERKRIGGGRTGFTASAVSGDGKLYYASEDGDVYVIKADRSAEELAVNPMGEVCMATPAISEGTLFIRTQKHVFAISE